MSAQEFVERLVEQITFVRKIHNSDGNFLNLPGFLSMTGYQQQPESVPDLRPLPVQIEARRKIIIQSDASKPGLVLDRDGFRFGHRSKAEDDALGIDFEPHERLENLQFRVRDHGTFEKMTTMKGADFFESLLHHAKPRLALSFSRAFFIQPRVVADHLERFYSFRFDPVFEVQNQPIVQRPAKVDPNLIGHANLVDCELRD